MAPDSRASWQLGHGPGLQAGDKNTQKNSEGLQPLQNRVSSAMTNTPLLAKLDGFR
jgi:hypothetical protein